MNDLKSITYLFSLILLSLIVLLAIVQNPLYAKFNSTVKALMVVENTEDIVVLLEKYPPLLVAKRNIEKVKAKHQNLTIYNCDLVLKI